MFISLSKDSNGSNLSADTLPRAPRVSQAIDRVEYGPRNSKCAPKNKGWKLCVNLVQTKFLGRFHVNVKGSMWTIFQAQTAIKSVLWLVSNRWLVAEIWSFQVLGWGGAPKLSLLGLHAVVYVPTIKFRAYDSWFTSLDTWFKLSINKVQTYLILLMQTWCKPFFYHQCKLWSNFV